MVSANLQFRRLRIWAVDRSRTPRENRGISRPLHCLARERSRRTVARPAKSTKEHGQRSSDQQRYHFGVGQGQLAEVVGDGVQLGGAVRVGGVHRELGEDDLGDAVEHCGFVGGRGGRASPDLSARALLRRRMDNPFTHPWRSTIDECVVQLDDEDLSVDAERQLAHALVAASAAAERAGIAISEQL